MKKFFVVPVFLMMVFFGISQTITVRGYTMDLKTREPLTGTIISCCDSSVVSRSNKRGWYHITVSKEAKYLYYYYPGYQVKTLDLQRHPRFSGQKINMVCDTCQINNLKIKKNVIAIALIETINRSTTLQYERFINRVHSVGILLGLYYNSYQLIFEAPVYTGLKIAPFYRFYTWRNNRNGGFFQIKLLGSYFELEDIYYSNNEYGFSTSGKFRTYGFGVAWGWAWYPFKTMAMNLSLGFQYLPMNVPRSITKDGISYSIGEPFLLININPWYWGGPGSAIEIKFTLGGIF